MAEIAPNALSLD